MDTPINSDDPIAREILGLLQRYGQPTILPKPFTVVEAIPYWNLEASWGDRARRRLVGFKDGQRFTCCWLIADPNPVDNFNEERELLLDR